MHWTDGRLRRVSRDGVVGAHAGVLEDYGCVATAYVDLAAATADPVWLERAGVLLDVAVAHFAAGDGGYFDTADDAEVLVVPSPRPGRQRQPVGAVRRWRTHCSATRPSPVRASTGPWRRAR